MRTLKLILSLLLGCCPAFAALPSGGIWECDAGGNTNNGGGFDPTDTANFLANATATGATGTTPNISSASYSFVAGDVGAWVYVASGTNWTPGWYKITSINGNAAVVNAAIGAAVQVSAKGVYSTNTVAGCATTASPTTGTFSVDYSQQAAAKVTDTTLASVGSSTTLTDTSLSFTPVMVGNFIHITNTGTGGFGILGWYEITAYTSTSQVTTDRTTNTGTAMAAGTGAIGGSVATLGGIGSASVGLGPVAQNIVWVNGSFTLTTTDTFAAVGSATAPISIRGYKSFRGDGYLGRTNTNGALIMTNSPALAYNVSSRLSITGTFVSLQNLNVTTSDPATALALAASCSASACSVTNSAANASAIAIGVAGADSIAYNCDAIESGATLATTGISATGGPSRVIACRVVMSSTNAAANGIVASGSATIVGNTIIGAGGSASPSGLGIFVSTTSSDPCLIGNTIYGFVDDINVITANTHLQCAVNNLLTDFSSSGFNLVSTANAAFLANNRYRQNTAGGTADIANTGQWTIQTNFNAVNTSLSTSDYATPGTDFRLLTTSPALAAAQPLSAAIGALQLPSTAPGQTAAGYSQ